MTDRNKTVFGKFMKKNVPSQLYDDGITKLKVMPGEFVPEAMIKRFNMAPGLFVHPDSLLSEGAFEFAAEHKEHFIVTIIRDMNGRGDVLMASVIAKALKYRYGDQVTVQYVVHDGYEDILKYNPYVDKVFTGRGQVKQADIQINVNDLEFKSELQEYEKTGNIVKNRASIYLENLGLWLENKTPVYIVQREEKIWAKAELLKRHYVKEKGKLIGVEMEGSNISRTYPHMKEVIKLLEKAKYQVIILDEKVNDKYRYNIRQLGAIVDQCDLIVSSNTFGYHLAGALKKHAVAIFGSCNGNIWVQDYEKITACELKCQNTGASYAPHNGTPKGKCWWDLTCLSGSRARKSGEKSVKEAPECLTKIKPEKVVREVKKHFKTKKVLIVVLTWNLSYLSKQMIDSIRSFHDYDILVLDNDSTDDTVEWCIKNNIEVKVDKLPVDEAWNIGLEEAYNRGYDYALICNNDCILSSSYIDTVIEVAERRKSFTTTGKVVNKYESTEVKFSDIIKDLELPEKIMVPGDYSAILISRKCIETLGGFRHFAPRYQCDEDYMLRIRLLGQDLIKTYATTFFHKHGAGVKENKDYNMKRRVEEWNAGEEAFLKEWKIRIYGENRTVLNNLEKIKQLNPDWKGKIYFPLKLKRGKK